MRGQHVPPSQTTCPSAAVKGQGTKSSPYGVPLSPDVPLDVVITPRLMTMQQAATYLNVSFWTARDWILAGYIPALDLPPLRPREGARQTSPTLRRVLVDRADLDRFIESRKRP